MFDRRPLSAGPVDEGEWDGAPWIWDNDVLAVEPKGDERCKNFRRDQRRLFKTH